MSTPAETPSVRIVWDRGSVPEWYELLATLPRSTLTQGFGYSIASMTVEGWKPRLGIVELGDKPIGLVVTVERRTAFGLKRIVQMHRGPLLRPEAAKPAVIASVFKAMREEYKRHPLRQFSMVPELEATEENAAILRWAGFRHLPGPGYRTVWLDLSRDEAALRRGLQQKWRNALNKAERSGLDVQIDRDGKTLDWLLPLYAQDCIAKQYVGPPPQLLLRLRTAMRKDGDFLILRALKKRDPVAAVLLLGHGKAATYQVGWTGPEGRATNAHNLLLWRAALELKRQGRHWLDVGGLLDRAPGVSAFKRGLGGEEVELTGVWV